MAASWGKGDDVDHANAPALRKPAAVECAGVPIHAVAPVAAVEDVGTLIARGVQRHVHLCNAFTLAEADSQPQLKQVLGQATRNYPDGTSVVLANRMLHRGVDVPRRRVYGPDLFEGVLEATRSTAP